MDGECTGVPCLILFLLVSVDNRSEAQEWSCPLHLILIRFDIMRRRFDGGIRFLALDRDPRMAPGMRPRMR